MKVIIQAVYTASTVQWRRRRPRVGGGEPGGAARHALAYAAMLKKESTERHRHTMSSTAQTVRSRAASAHSSVDSSHGRK